MAKKDNPDRGLFQRKTRQGRLEWWIRYADTQGRERREKVGESKAAARQLYLKRKEEARIGKKLPENLRQRELTIGDLVEKYEPFFAQKKAARDHRRYGRYAVTAFGDVQLSQLTPADVERYRRKRLDQKKAPATINRAVAYLKRVYNLAIRDGLFLGPNPVARVKQLQENNSRIRWLDEAEEARLRPACTPHFWRAVEVAFLSGLRQSEQFKMERTDLNFKARVITVRESKHGEARRIPMTDRLAELLEEQLASHRSPWVWPGQDPEQHYRGRSAIGVFQTALRRAKIENFRWHDLRHTFCSRLAMAGVSLETIRQLAGHKTITITQRYAHLSPEHNRAAMELLSLPSRPAITIPVEALAEPSRLVAILQEHLSGHQVGEIGRALLATVERAT